MRHCKCGKKLAAETRGKLCRRCFDASRRKPDKFCTDCGTQVDKDNKGGRCRPCVMKMIQTDPRIQAARIEAARAAARRPEVRAQRSAQISERNRRPGVREKLVEAGKRNYHRTIGSEKAKQAALRPDVIAKRAFTHSRRDLPWLPDAYREQYMRLLHSCAHNAASAKREILRRMRADEVKRLAVLHASEAADFLRKFTPVSRRDDGWRYGNTILTSEEIIERAQLRGWQPWSLAA